MKTFIPIVAAGLALTLPFLAQRAVAQEAITESDLASVDVDADGAISEAEYLTYMDGVFTRIDADGNGILQSAELSTVLTPEQIAATDTRGDGTVSRAEFDARVKADFEAADRDGTGALN